MDINGFTVHHSYTCVAVRGEACSFSYKGTHSKLNRLDENRIVCSRVGQSISQGREAEHSLEFRTCGDSLFTLELEVNVSLQLELL